ncbi:MAG: methyltransferase domain-containing protein [Elusimicrobia bacterium]|nr:methyltransferase domain-containing protein [Elusimicrobiota bacterium]
MPDAVKGLVEQLGGWDGVYKTVKPEELPWNAGFPDSDLRRLVEASRLPLGRALDAGTGPGHDAAYLALNGWDVLAVDVSPAALALAARTVRAAYAEGRVTLRQADVLTLREPAESFALVHDRGCFHTLDAKDRPRYVALVERLLGPGGKVVLRTFSDKEPAGPGPHRFPKAELETAWSSGFVFEELREGIFEGPRKPKAWLALLRKRS